MGILNAALKLPTLAPPGPLTVYSPGTRYLPTELSVPSYSVGTRPGVTVRDSVPFGPLTDRLGPASIPAIDAKGGVLDVLRLL